MMGKRMQLISSEKNLYELCAFAPLRETKRSEMSFSQRRKGAKAQRVFQQI